MNNQRYRPNLEGIAHVEVDRAMRNAFDAIYDTQDGVTALRDGLVGGALCITTVVAGVIHIQMTSGGYYVPKTPPKVVITTNGTGYSGTAILTGNRVTSVTIKQGSGATTASVAFTP